MGAHIAKELGVYNEEEKICTPKNVGHERYRMLKNDPRSVTAGIARTPIQVECTPTGVKSLPRVRSITKSENSYSEEVEKKKQEENDSGFKEVEVSVEVKEESKCVTPELIRYLETDIDKVDSPVLNVDSPLKTVDSSTTDIHHSTLITEEKPEPALVDFLSPSVKISRTPHLVECTPELFALHSRIDSLSFCDFDGHNEDPSAVVSDEEHSSPRNQSTINKWLFGVENKAATPGNDSFTDSPRTVAKKQKELNALKKQLFFTPEIRVTEPAKPKARTPLGDLQSAQLRESPQRMLKTKQWRNVAEERKRRGLDDAENTPPNLHLPPLMSVASAPSKITEYKRTKINWDSENAMMI